MKNVHSLLHLFGEQRMVFESAEKTDLKKIETEYFGNNAEDLKEKEKRLTDIHNFLANEKDEYERIKGIRLETVTNLEVPEGQPGTVFFGEMILNSNLSQLTKQMELSGRQQILRQTDLKKSFDQALTVKDIEDQRKSGGYTAIRFLKNETESKIAIEGVKKDGTETSGLVYFDIQSDFTKETLKNREKITEEISAEREEIQKQIAEELTAMGRLETEAKTWTENLKTTLQLEGNYETEVTKERATWGDHEEYVSISIRRLPAENVLRIDTNFENGEYKYLLRNYLNGQELASNKGSKEGPIFPDPERDIRPMLFEVEKGEKYEKDEAAKIIETEPSIEEKEEEQPAVTVEKIEGSKKVDEKKTKIETDKKTGLRELVVTTKRGTKLAYRETGKRTQGGEKNPAGSPIWQYENSDEYYVDSGLRVNEDGSDYTGKGQKESKILGQHVKLTRDLEKDFSKQTGRKIKLEEKTENPDKFKIETGIKATETAVKNIVELVKQKDVKYSTLDNVISELEKLGKAQNLWGLMPELKAVTLDVYGVKLSWTKEGGFEDSNKEILKTKIIQILTNSPETDLLEKFLAHEKTYKTDKDFQEKVEKAQKEWKEKYKEKMKKTYKLGFKDFGGLSFDDTARMSEEELAEEWKRFNGTEGVMKIMTNQFDLHPHEIPRKVAAIVSEGNNYEVEFKDIMKFLPPNQSALNNIDVGQLMDRMGEKDSILNFSEEIDKEDIEEMLSSPEELEKTLDKLMASKLEADKFLADKLFKHIVAPSIDLLESLQDLRPSNAKKEEEAEENLPEEQLKAIQQIEKLCKTQDGRSGWEKFKNGLKGLGDFTYMTQLDGTTSFKDKSVMTRELTEGGAKNFILYNNEYFDIDFVNNLKKFDIEKLQAAANKFIQLGYLQKYMSEIEGGDGKMPTQEEVKKAMESEEFKKGMTGLEIKDLLSAEITKDQINAFQIGLLVEYNSRYEKQMKMPENKAARDLCEWALKNGISASEIQGALENLVAVGGIQMNSNGEIVGGGAGVNIPLSKNISVLLHVESTDAGANFNYEFKGPGRSKFSISVGVSLKGVNAGIANRHQIAGKLAGTVFTGAKWNIFEGDLIPKGGVGYSISIDIDKAVEQKTKEILKEKDFVEIAEAIDSNDSTKVLELAKEHPRYGLLATERKVKVGEKELTLSEEEITALIGMDYKALKAEGALEASKSLLGTDWLPITEIGVGFPSFLVFKVGLGMKASRPMLREEAKLLGLQSELATENKINLEMGVPEDVEYTEDLEGVYLTKDGRIGHLEKDGKKEVDFSSFADTASRNSKLEKARMQIEVHGGDRVLKIYDLKGIEAEIHPDPALRGELAVRTDGEEVVLEGNVDNLVITRERIIFPGKTGKYGSSVRDVIVIKKKYGSGRSKITEQEAAYLEKLPGYQWTVKDGSAKRFGVENNSVFDVKGWQSANPELRGELKKSRAQEKDVFAFELDDKAKLLREYKGIPTEKASKLTEAVESEETQEKIKNGIDKAMTEDTKTLKTFRNEVKEAIDDPQALIKVLAKYEKELFGKDLSDSERNLAVQYLTRAYFIDLATKAAKNLNKTPEEFSALTEEDLENPKTKAEVVKYINQAREILVKNAKYVAKAFETEFDQAIQRLKSRGVKISEEFDTGEEVAEKMVKDIAGTLKEVDKNTSPEDLLAHPLFSLETESLIPGSTICYGTHKREGGKEIPAMAKTLQSQETAQRTIREAGFIKDTATEYMVKGGDEMGMILFETANPVPDSYEYLINSEFGVKIASLGALVLMISNEDYTNVMKAFGTKGDISEYQASLEKFKKICEIMRKNELADQPTVAHWKDLTINIYLTARARSIAWSDCGNAGFESAEEGYLEILKGGKPLVATNETLEKVDPSIQKLYLEFGFGISLVPEEKKAKPEKPEKPGGKYTSKTTKAVAGKASVSEKNKGGAQPKGKTLTYEGEAAGLDKALGNK